MIGEVIRVSILCAKLAPAFILIGLGVRYLFYTVDAWNLDRIYEKYFNGRRKKKYRLFTQRVGLVLIVLGAVYAWFFVWPIVDDLFFDK